MATPRRSSVKARRSLGPIPPRSEAFFGMAPLAFIGDVCNALNEYVCDGVDALEEYLKGLDAFRDHTEAVHEACTKVFERLIAAADKNEDKFEMYAAQHVFTIPANVVIPEDGQTSSAGPTVTSREEEAALDVELAELHSKIHEARTGAVLARRETAALERDLVRFREAQESGQFDLVARVCAAHEGVQSMEDILDRVHQNIEILRKEVCQAEQAVAAVGDRARQRPHDTDPELLRDEPAKVDVEETYKRRRKEVETKSIEDVHAVGQALL